MMTKIFQRAKDVWKPGFLEHFVESGSKSHKTTWLFWIASSLFVAIILSVTVTVFVYSALPKVIDGIDHAIPDGANLSVENGILTIDGLEQPYVVEDEENNDSVLIIDTQTDTYAQGDLDAYATAVLISKDGIYQKEDKVRSRQFSFSEVDDFAYSKDELMPMIDGIRSIVVSSVAIISFLFLTTTLMAFRLLSALWWALLLMLCAMLFGMTEKFATYYFAVLNLYFIPLVIESILILFGVSISFSTTIIFLILFIINLTYWKKKRDAEGMPAAPKVDVEKSIPGTVLPAD